MPAWDHAGVVLSALCLIHCLGAPLAILFLPALGLILAPAADGVHTVLATVVPITALLAFVPGYRRHRNARILYAASAGVGAIVAAAFLLPEDAGTAAEALNYRRRRLAAHRGTLAKPRVLPALPRVRTRDRAGRIRGPG